MPMKMHENNYETDDGLKLMLEYYILFSLSFPFVTVRYTFIYYCY